jgi:transposase-like protein
MPSGNELHKSDLTRLPATFDEATSYFSTSACAIAFIASRRWRDGVVHCPVCGSSAVTYLATRQIWECCGEHLRLQFSVRTGTIFEASHISLNDWLVGIWLLVTANRKVSSYEMARRLRITQKSAWLMLRRIKHGLSLRAAPDHRLFKILGGIDSAASHAAAGAAVAGAGAGSSISPIRQPLAKLPYSSSQRPVPDGIQKAISPVRE